MNANKYTYQLAAWALALLALVGCTQQQKEERPVISVAPAHTQDVEIYGDYVGRILPNREVEVRARVEGFVQQVLFEGGRKVQAQAPLFQIDPLPYKARVEKAEAQLKKDMAMAAKAKRDVERLRPLYQQNAASQLDLDNAVAALDNAEATVRMSQADLAQAKLLLSYTTVRAPMTGMISEPAVVAGAVVGPGANSLLAKVVQSDTVRVDFSMTSLDYLRSKQRNVKLGEQDANRSWQQTVRITLADDSDYPLPGIVNFAEPQVDPKTGTFTVQAILPNPEQKLLPGQFTKVKLLLDVVPKAVVVPRKSLLIEKGGAFLYVVRPDSTMEKRFVQLGPEVGQQMVVERGLTAGEMVVSEGQHKLNPGIKVNPQPEGQQPSSH